MWRTFNPRSSAPRSPLLFPTLCLHFGQFQIKIMKALEDDADYKLKTLKENDLDNKDIEEIKVRLNGQATSLEVNVKCAFQLRLKDKHCGDEFVHEFEDGTKRMEQYIKVAICISKQGKSNGKGIESSERIHINQVVFISYTNSQAMEREITKRRQVIELLGQGRKYYDRYS